MKKIWICIIFISLMAGCQKDSIPNGNGFTVENNELINHSLEKLFVNSLKKQYKDTISQVKITESDNNDEHAAVVTFLCNHDNKKYSGILVASKLGKESYELVYLDIFEVFQNQKITINNISGEIYVNNVRRSFHIVSGYINDSEIDMIDVLYPGNEISGHSIKKDQKTYADIRIGSNEKPVSVIAVSGDKIILQKDYQ